MTLIPYSSCKLSGSLNSGVDFAGNKLDGGTSFCTGAVSGINPEKPLQIIKLEKKTKCGADFIQTQAVYDVGMFEEFMEAISHLEVPVIAGLIPLKSFGMAEFMNKNISGISVPEEIMFCMKEASNPVEEGLIHSIRDNKRTYETLKRSSYYAYRVS